MTNLTPLDHLVRMVANDQAIADHLGIDLQAVHKARQRIGDTVRRVDGRQLVRKCVSGEIEGGNGLEQDRARKQSAELGSAALLAAIDKVAEPFALRWCLTMREAYIYLHNDAVPQ